MNRDLQPIPGSKYCDVRQAANFLCVSIPTIRKWLSAGKKLTRYRAGRRVLILVSQLDALVVADGPAEGEAAK
jgi:excisionase family DNA binding protein